MKISLLLFILFPVFAPGQMVSEDNVYGLISQIFEEKEEDYKLDLDLIPYNNRHFKAGDLLNLDFLKQNILTRSFSADTTIFNRVDLGFMESQVEESRNRKRLNEKHLSIDRKYLLIHDNRSEQPQRFPEFQTYKISWPLFSKDKKAALMYVENFCGIECGGGQINIYALMEDSSWKWIGAILIWVS
ncbi:hypothetical protein [Robiginitalea marina]|uniref:Uncharacterized protein n=1 Tax=Robiginitalea marina TaxID=2954105 RepID=A0ABT1AY96_9FLAO|nr:hypothetical protein [Robiginitalea marina]MCO5725005.1 hypothetical protein [Robiginitalea marina]